MASNGRSVLKIRTVSEVNDGVNILYSAEARYVTSFHRAYGAGMQVSGFVLDASTEAGLSDVVVTDGRQWARTDQNGHFTLPSSLARHVWVRVPRGWNTTQWWSSRSAELTFRLHRQEQPSLPMRFAHLTDTHVSTLAGDPSDAVELAVRHGDGTDTAAALDRTLQQASDSGAGFAVITGDLTDHGTAAEFDHVHTTISRAPLPVYVIPGNHDHYGHRHEPRDTDSPLGGGFLGDATVERYEEELGPRWWSRTIAGMHVIALDWFSAWCGIDDQLQLEFLAADLARVEPNTPVLVLTHDQLPTSWLRHLHASAQHLRLIGVLSGHWHAPKVIVDQGCAHVSTGPAGFGGLDWSPPQLRLLDWDGTSLTPHTPTPVTNPGSDPVVTPPADARHQSLAVGTGQHLGRITCAKNRWIVPSYDDTTQRNYLSAIDVDGTLHWHHSLGTTPLTGLTSNDDQIIAASVSGLITCVSPDGSVLWTYQLGSHLHNRLHNAPITTDNGMVVTGNLADLAALSISTGEPHWHRDDLGPVDTLLTYGIGTATDDTVILPFGGPYRGMTSLEIATGTVRWADDSGTPLPLSDVVPVGVGDALLVRSGPTIERFHLETGQIRWRTPLQGRFSTAAPHHDGHTITLVSGDGIVHRLDIDTGIISARTPIPATRPAHGPYRTTGTGAPTAPVHCARGLVIVLIDGSVWQLPEHGQPTMLTDLNRTVTTQPAVLGDRLAILDTRGTVHIVSL
ncbi:hypothetical protein GCM10027597_18300 [Saccharopolyspora tripterygii]